MAYYITYITKTNTVDIVKSELQKSKMEAKEDHSLLLSCQFVIFQNVFDKEMLGYISKAHFTRMVLVQSLSQRVDSFLSGQFSLFTESHVVEKC